MEEAKQILTGHIAYRVSLEMLQYALIGAELLQVLVLWSSISNATRSEKLKANRATRAITRLSLALSSHALVPRHLLHT
jgi:hypothetical protein